jgi:hypothetical protein
MSIQFANDAYGICVSPIGIDDTNIQIAQGGWSKFPDLVAEDHYCYISIIQRGKKVVSEIVKATSFSNGVFTVERGVDNTEALAHPSGCRIAVRLVSASLYALRDEAVRDAAQNMQSMFNDIAEAMRQHAEILDADLPIRKGEDLLSEEALNAQAVFLNTKVNVLTSAIMGASTIN